MRTAMQFITLALGVFLLLPVASAVAQDTPTPTETPTETETPTVTHTPTPTNTPTATPTHTPGPFDCCETSDPDMCVGGDGFGAGCPEGYDVVFNAVCIEDSCATRTPTPTVTNTPTNTPVNTATHTPTVTHTATATLTFTPSPTPSETPVSTNTPTVTHTPLPTNTSPPTPFCESSFIRAQGVPIKCNSIEIPDATPVAVIAAPAAGKLIHIQNGLVSAEVASIVSFTSGSSTVASFGFAGAGTESFPGPMCVPSGASVMATNSGAEAATFNYCIYEQ